MDIRKSCAESYPVVRYFRDIQCEMSYAQLVEDIAWMSRIGTGIFRLELDVHELYGVA